MWRSLLFKDLRTVSWEAGILLLLGSAFVWEALRPTPVDEVHVAQADAMFWIILLIVLASFVIIARIVHEEPPFSIQSYWRTKPIAGPMLLGSKVLAALLLLTLPAIATQIAILLARSFSPVALYAEIFQEQATVWAFWILPLLAIASLTRTTGTMFFASVGCLLMMLLVTTLVLAWRPDSELMLIQTMDVPMQWMLNVVASALVLWLQYALHRPRMAWMIVVSYVSVPAVIMAFAVYGLPVLQPGRRTADFGPQLASVSSGSSLQPVSVSQGNSYYALPIRLEGAPEGTVLNAVRVSVQLLPPGTTASRPGVPAGTAQETARYLIWRGESVIVFSIAGPRFRTQQSKRHDLQVSISGELHPKPRARWLPAIGSSLILSDRLHCAGLTPDSFRLELQCKSAYQPQPSVLLRVRHELGEFAIPLRLSEGWATVPTSTVSASLFNPVAAPYISDALAPFREPTWPPHLRDAVHEGATVTALEAGTYFYQELTLRDIELEFPSDLQDPNPGGSQP